MEVEYSLSYIISNIIAIFAVIAAVVWPMISRVLLSSIFITAGIVNGYVAITDPGLYLGYGELALNDFYRSVISGPFSQCVQCYVLIIATGQLLVGIFISYKGRLMKIAMTGAILFLLAVAPLGVGAAFPATLLMALAFVVLLGKKIDFSIYELLRQKIHYSNP